MRGYERGFHLRNDYYNGINFAYLLNVRAASSSRARRRRRFRLKRPLSFAPTPIACFVDAGKVRAEVLKICETVLQTETLSDDDKYWVLATMAEAYLGTGDEERAPSRSSMKPSPSRRRRG